MTKTAYIRKLKGKNLYRVYSEKGRNMGTYPSLKGAKKRLGEIEMFKRMNSSSDHLFPRGGDGNVPQFFRKNLDYGERDSALKKLKRLKATQDYLDNGGFKKEAGSLFKSMAVAALALIATAFSGSLSGKIPMVKDLLYKNIAEDVEKSEVQYSSHIPTSDEEITTIIHDFYRELNLGYVDLLYISSFVAQHNNIQYKNIGQLVIPAGKEIKIPSIDYIKNLVKETVAEQKVENPSTVLMPYSDIKFNARDLQFISDVEASRGKAYDDRSPKTLWSAGVTPKGRWTIGRGHLLTKDELASGELKIGESVVDWRRGITEDQSDKLFLQDADRNTFRLNSIFEDYFATPDIKKVVFDIAFLYGQDDAKELLDNSKDESTKTIDLVKFKNNLENFRLSSQTGAVSRRIADLLILENIKVPALKPDEEMSINKILNLYNNYFNSPSGPSEPNVWHMTTPSKNNIDLIILTRGGFDPSKSENKDKVFAIYKLIKKEDPKTLDAFLKIIDRFKQPK